MVVTMKFPFPLLVLIVLGSTQTAKITNHDEEVVKKADEQLDLGLDLDSLLSLDLDLDRMALEAEDFVRKFGVDETTLKDVKSYLNQNEMIANTARSAKNSLSKGKEMLRKQGIVKMREMHQELKNQVEEAVKHNSAKLDETLTKVTGLSSEDLEARVLKMATTTKEVTKEMVEATREVAANVAKSVFNPIANTFSDWFNLDKSWSSRRRRDLDSEQQPVENLLDFAKQKLNMFFAKVDSFVPMLQDTGFGEAFNAFLSLSQDRSVFVVVKIVLVGILMMVNLAIAFTLPFYI